MFSGCVVVSQSQLLLGEYPPPEDPLAKALLKHACDQLFRQPVFLPKWISSQRRFVVEQVADRLVRQHHVVREQHRRFWRKVTCYSPTRPTEIFMRSQRLATYLRNRMELTELDVVLAGLSVLIGQETDLLELDVVGRAHLDRLICLLPTPLRELLAATEAAIPPDPRGLPGLRG